MANRPQQITITFTADQMDKLDTIMKLTGNDITNVIRTALEDLHKKVMSDEEGKKLAKINSMLDVQ